MKCLSCATEIPDNVQPCPACGATLDGSFAPTRRLEGEPYPRPRQAPISERKASSGSIHSTDSTDQARFVAGTILAARYRIVGLLGRGGMGEVYRADDLKLGQPVALKFLPEELLADEAAMARFHREVRIARQISHPNVCRVYDIGECDGQHFLSMEYIKGEELASTLRRFGRLPAGKATEIARQICAGLAAAHKMGVLHRDLKPANVMIDEHGNARITDFGLAALAEEVRSDELAGTPAYMSPEQLTGKGLTTKSDIYSLGLVLYELYTGRRAFNARTLPELLRLRQSDAQPSSPSSLVKNLDPLVERIIERCLKKDPEERPASALQVAAALPGGDPLAAALAMGETPSPEMVAATTTERGLRPAVAAALLIGALLALAADMLFSNADGLYNKVPLDKSPEVLSERAREVVRQLGYREVPTDHAEGFGVDPRYLNYIRDSDQTPRWWDKLATGQPAALIFWYRQSPDYLRPWYRQNPDFLVQVNPFVVTADNPPPMIPGMTYVLLDTQGHLIKFAHVPPPVDAASTSAPDWSTLFSAAGLDAGQFTPTEPQWNPPAYADARAAWVGTYPSQPQIPLRVEAAAYHGTPVYFAEVGAWEKPARLEDSQKAPLEQAYVIFFSLLCLLTLIGGAILARHNLKLGAGDRRGAFRLALFILIAGGVVRWVLGRHLPEVSTELGSFILSLSYSLFLAGFVWLVYIALEPFLRRRWPKLLISWNRLLSGSIRDPLIGRDILIGGLGAAVFDACEGIQNLVMKWLGKPPRITFYYGSTLLGTRPLLDRFVSQLVQPLIYAMLFLCLFLLLAVVVRKRWLAMVLLWLLASITYGLLRGSVVDLITAGIPVVIFVATLVRYGLLATYMGFIFFFLAAWPFTTNFSAWYATPGLFASAVGAALLFYGFYISLAGEPLLRGRRLLED